MVKKKLFYIVEQITNIIVHRVKKIDVNTVTYLRLVRNVLRTVNFISTNITSR
jgi:hypothetical protein